MNEKRKTRLNKTQGGKTEFLGFGAFADTEIASHSQEIKNVPAKAPTPTLRWSPVYTGQDSDLSTLFPRLLKRDATTKVKALQELQDYFQKDNLPKKQQVDALSHFVFLYYSKLSYDSSSSVRAEALLVLTLAATRVPKAFQTLAHQNRQVLGMMYCCHGDPAAEVRSVAKKHLKDENIHDDESSYSQEDMEMGVWEYIERILSYGRAKNMHDDLFTSSLKGNHKAGEKSGKSFSSSEELNESQRDQLEEQFERIVGSAITGMQIWVQNHGILAGNSAKHNDADSSFLWKSLSSPKTSLRRKTYELLGTCTQKAPTIIFGTDIKNKTAGFSQHISQALASEKEPGNIPALLEAFLGYLAAYSGHSGSSSTPWDSLNSGTVTKHLAKIYKKSCYGAPATHWGPSLLPLLTMLPSTEDQVSVLAAAWKGRENAVRLVDQTVVAATVSESASYFLLREHNQSSETLEDSNGVPPNHKKSETNDLVELWLDALKYFLEMDVSSKPTMHPAYQAQISLGKGLARELHKFDVASFNRPNCALHVVREWFWNSMWECLIQSDRYAAIAMIVEEIISYGGTQSTTLGSSQTQPSRLSPILREKFQHILSNFQQASGSVPTADVYKFLIITMKYCGVTVLNSTGEGELSSTAGIEKFIMNDVLRWMVIHTSRLSQQRQTAELAQNDFTIFGFCAAELPPDKRENMWNSLLREVIAAQCDLYLLVAGLKALLHQGKIPVEEIRCNVLDKFAIDIVDDYIASHHERISSDNDSIGTQDEENKDDESLRGFLTACAGLSENVPALVGGNVVSTWVDHSCISRAISSEHVSMPPSVIETLLALASSSSVHKLDMDSIERVVIQAWWQGGRVWEDTAIRLLLHEPIYSAGLFRQGSEILRETLHDWSSKPQESNSDVVAQLWAKKARRLLQSCKKISIVDSEAPLPTLGIVNLADKSLWESAENHAFLFSCLMYLFQYFPDIGERLDLVQSSAETETMDLIVTIFLSLCEASDAVTSAIRTSRHQDHSSQFLGALGGSCLGDGLILKWLAATTSSLEEFVQQQDCAKIRKSVGFVSQLVDLVVDRPKSRDVFSASEDDQDLEEMFKRERIAKIIVPALHKGPFATLPWNSCFSELINVVISQCGLGEERGIGSLHYDVFQLIFGAAGRLRDLLVDEESKKTKIPHELWLLSLSCGFGLNTPPSAWDSKSLMFDAEQLTMLLLDLVDESEDIIVASDLVRAALVWLITCSAALKNSDLRERALSYIYKSSLSLLNSESGDFFGENTALALKGIYSAQLVSRANPANCEQLEIQAITKVMQGFAYDWEDEVKEGNEIICNFDSSCRALYTSQPSWKAYSYFPNLVSAALESDSSSMVAAASHFVEGLVRSLFVESKRWFAFRILNVIALSADPFNDATPEESTIQRLSEWSKHLDDEEKEELKEDIEVVSEILPHGLMSEMESWVEEDIAESMEERLIVGRALVWLVFLGFVDASVQKDAANRPSFCSYIDKCEAVESILNLTILHTGIGTEKKSESKDLVGIDALLKDEEKIESTTLASIVLFRTVQALPSLSRRWWEDECPRVYTTTIREYLEAQVAPVILRSELDHIKLASLQKEFGAMSVTGSVVTREITATYTQDEINLKVQIHLPSCFPLRSAEVDCSQTLGVPQKRWKLWSLQITQMLNSQGGTLHEALLLWKENVDKEFEGVEPCPVCYSVLHVKSHKLPELECTTCSNRFHVSCLTQWFKSSGKTQCVICQQPWVGTRAKK